VRVAGQQRAQALGEHVLSVLLERDGAVLDDDEGKRLAELLGVVNKRDLLIAIGEGKISQDALDAELANVKGIHRRRHKPIDLPVADKAEGWFALRAIDQFRFRVPGGQGGGPEAKAALDALSFNTPVSISPEGVVPGDRLVGILTPESPITIYPIHSDALVGLHDSDVAWIDVRWDMAHRDREYKVVITMESVNRPGSLAHIASAIASCDVNINNLMMRMISPDFHELIFEVEVRDLAQLTDVLATLKRNPGVTNVQRASTREAGMISFLEWDGATKH
jgi:guanosine-3',5'-bis(diphosphate) 3'-pyrophosphohydrolase